MEESNENEFDTQLGDINRLWELGFIDSEERGVAQHNILLQGISDELDRMVKRSHRHPEDFPLDK
jgi:hypothetical protein